MAERQSPNHQYHSADSEGDDPDEYCQPEDDDGLDDNARFNDR
jgi:hypothetical protein